MTTGNSAYVDLNDNLISRAWGDQRLSAYKSLPPTPHRRWGEAFEVCAFAGDEEASAHPGIIRLADGSEVELPELLAAVGPESEYERTGDVPDVVFPCGWILEDDARTVRLYYGAADTTVCVATGDLEEIIGYLYRHCIRGQHHEPGEHCPVAAVESVEVTSRQ